MSKLYALVKNGIPFPFTLSDTKRGVWGNSFNTVAQREPGFEAKYWKRWDASLAAAKRMGYSIEEVVIYTKKELS